MVSAQDIVKCFEVVWMLSDESSCLEEPSEPGQFFFLDEFFDFFKDLLAIEQCQRVWKAVVEFRFG